MLDLKDKLVLALGERDGIPAPPSARASRVPAAA